MTSSPPTRVRRPPAPDLRPCSARTRLVHPPRPTALNPTAAPGGAGAFRQRRGARGSRAVSRDATPRPGCRARPHRGRPPCGPPAPRTPRGALTWCGRWLTRRAVAPLCAVTRRPRASLFVRRTCRARPRGARRRPGRPGRARPRALEPPPGVTARAGWRGAQLLAAGEAAGERALALAPGDRAAALSLAVLQCTWERILARCDADAARGARRAAAAPPPVLSEIRGARQARAEALLRALLASNARDTDAALALALLLKARPGIPPTAASRGASPLLVDGNRALLSWPPPPRAGPAVAARGAHAVRAGCARGVAGRAGRGRAAAAALAARAAGRRHRRRASLAPAPQAPRLRGPRARQAGVPPPPPPSY